MCGIAGFVSKREGGEYSALSRQLLDTLRHRGPDGLGWFTFGEKIKSGREVTGVMPCRVALFHRRLSILDLSEAGHQPMVSDDGNYVISFNGEIYNYRELRAELEKEGCKFRSSSDTEVLLNAFIRWGQSCLNRLVGMFAFAILDIRARELFLARDFFGIKPLFFTQWRDGFAFASEIKALLLFPGVRRKANPQKLFYYLRYGYTDFDADSLFQGIQQLKPGQCMSIKLEQPDQPQIRTYWELKWENSSSLSFEDATAELRRLFEENIRLHLRSDVPVGAALSGGIDSSAIVCAATPYLNKGDSFNTFSYIADDPAVSEEKWVDLVNGTTNAKPHKILLQPSDLKAEIEDFIRTHDEPVASSSMFAQYSLFKAVQAAGIKVMLDGQGADELFAGYRYYYSARLASQFRSGEWLEGVQLLRNASRLPGLNSRFLLGQTLDHFLPKSARKSLRRWIGSDLAPAWMNLDYFRRNGVEPEIFYSSQSRSYLKDRLRQSFVVDTLPRLLRYEDRNSMRFSVESRVPFLTPRLVQFVFNLPEKFIITNDAKSKAIFRKAMRGTVPDEILDRKDKIGFTTAELKWLKELRPWVQEQIASKTTAEIPALNQRALATEFENLFQSKKRYSWAGWRWINTIVWARLFQVEF